MYCLDSFADYICREICVARGDQAGAAAFQLSAEANARLIINRDMTAGKSIAKYAEFQRMADSYTPDTGPDTGVVLSLTGDDSLFTADSSLVSQPQEEFPPLHEPFNIPHIAAPIAIAPAIPNQHIGSILFSPFLFITSLHHGPLQHAEDSGSGAYCSTSFD